MEANPYEPSVDAEPLATNPVTRAWQFSFWTVGPITGASVGLAHVAAMVFAWAIHGHLDFLLRSGDSALIFAGAMSIGGAIFGIPYAGVVAICSRVFNRSVHPRLHFWIATIASFAATYVAADTSLRRRDVVSPFFVLATIIGVSFFAALVTASQSYRADPDLR